MAGKMSKEQANEAIEETIGLLLKANNYMSIYKHIAKKYGIKERQAKDYIARARQEIITRFEPDSVSERVISSVRFNDLYQKNYTKGDYKECRAVQEASNKLLGINAPEKTDNRHLVSVEITKRDVELFNDFFNKEY